MERSSAPRFFPGLIIHLTIHEGNVPLDRLTALELLNATHTFPCAFTLKVIGLSDDDFVLRCLEVVHRAVTDAEEFDYTTRATPNGRHISVTMQPVLDSAEHVLEVYACLQEVKGVVMTM